MRFKIEDKVIHFYLSNREIEKYDGEGGLSAENTLEDGDMPFKIENGGRYDILINGRPIQLKTKTGFSPKSGYTAEVEANGHLFRFVKINEITKYDVFRELLKHYKKVVKTTGDNKVGS